MWFPFGFSVVFSDLELYIDCSYTATSDFGGIIAIQSFAITVHLCLHFFLEVSPWDLCYSFLIHINLGDWLTCQGLDAISTFMT